MESGCCYGSDLLAKVEGPFWDSGHGWNREETAYLVTLQTGSWKDVLVAVWIQIMSWGSEHCSLSLWPRGEVVSLRLCDVY